MNTCPEDFKQLNFCPYSSSSSITVALSSNSVIFSSSGAVLVLPSSSGANLPSSSTAELPPPSSASVPTTHILTCTILNSTFPAGTIIPVYKRPELKCTEINTGKVIVLDTEYDVGSWANAPLWRVPQAGIYSNIEVKIDRDGSGKECQGLIAKCVGTITITAGDAPIEPVPPSSPSTTPSSSSVASETGGPCKDGGSDAYCKWGSDCSQIDSRYGYMGETENDQTCGPKASRLCACADLIMTCKDYSDSKTIYHSDKCTSGGGGGSSSDSGSGSGRSSGSSGGGITLSTTTRNSTHNAGSYTVTANGVNKCSVNCQGDNKACSLSGAISQSGQNYLGNISVASGSVTITGTVIFNNCWKE